MSTAREQAVSLLQWVRGVSNGMLKDWPKDKWTYQSSPKENHALWAMGHLAQTDAWIAGVLGIPGVDMKEAWSPLFGQKSSPSTDAAKYPNADEVKAWFDANREKLLAGVAKLSDAQLGASLKEKTGGFANDGFDALLKTAWHEGWHMGPVATARKTLALPSIMGG